MSMATRRVNRPNNARMEPDLLFDALNQAGLGVEIGLETPHQSTDDNNIEDYHPLPPLKTPSTTKKGGSVFELFKTFDKKMDMTNPSMPYTSQLSTSQLYIDKDLIETKPRLPFTVAVSSNKEDAKPRQPYAMSAPNTKYNSLLDVYKNTPSTTGGLSPLLSWQNQLLGKGGATAAQLIAASSASATVGSSGGTSLLYGKGTSLLGGGATSLKSVGGSLMGGATSLLDAATLAGANGEAAGGNRMVNNNAQIAKMWKNDSKVVPQMNMFDNSNSIAMKEGEFEDGEDEEEELGHAETYADYMPSKLRVGERHPDPVVETSSLSSVPPPNVTYQLAIPEKAIDLCYLSALQLEAIVYACQQHEQYMPDGSRAGFLIGDGAGVGKGRTIAGIIYENFLRERKRSIWISVSNDLKYDAERDLRDIGAEKIEVHSLSKLKYAKVSSKVNGSIKKGVIFSTYSALIGESQSGGKYKTRMKQLLHWCGEDFSGVIVFDECHKAKNLCPTGSTKPTKTGISVQMLQAKLPKARIVYASATGASEPRNMAYMTRLGLWGSGTPFPEFSDYIQAVEKRGVGAMEIVAMDMKLRGTYIARQLSFSGVTFKIEEIPLDRKFIRVYDESVKLWVLARERFQQAVELIEGEQRMKKTMWGQFWSGHQRFFKYMCIASKVPHAVKLAREAVHNGKCVVLGLQSTGEARTLEQLEEAGGELTDFVSTAKGVFQTLVEKHFPAPDRKRIHRLLGLENILDTSPMGSPSTSGKRKPERRARQGAKRYKEEHISEDSGSPTVDSDFIASSSSSSSSEDSPASPNGSGSESDFNPFKDGSDSDADVPWLNRKAKKIVKDRVKTKKVKEKKPPMQRKIRKRNNDYSDEEDEDDVVVPNGKRNGSGSVGANRGPPVDAIEQACAMKDELLARLEKLNNDLPPNTLDQLIDELGGPENVAEMTGRKGRVVSNDDGSVQYESRSELDVPLETLNLTEKQRFMDGDKHIAIISEAASSGISLQSDRRAKNQRRRVHITLELPWSADRAIQQFGRTHRSNQVNAPEYLFLISDLAGERRFASTVAKRLESLGALTHGDRRATETRDLSQFNIDNKYGRATLETIMKAIVGLEVPLIPPPKDYKGDFFADVQKALVGVGLLAQDENFSQIVNLDKDYNNMSKFLNRILGMEVELQNRLFKYFSDTLVAIINQAKRAGRFDMGILDLGSGGDQVKRIKCHFFEIKHATGTAKIELHTVGVERGLSWEQATDIWKELVGTEEGFYQSPMLRNGRLTTVLAVVNATGSKKKEKGGEKMYSIYRPNTGVQLRQESLSEIKKKYKKVVPDIAEPAWKEQYQSAATTCSHVFWRGSCRRVIVGVPCDLGLRRKTYNILSGSVLSAWSTVEMVLASMPGSNSAKMQVIRVRTEDGRRIVGTVIPLNGYQQLIKVLGQDCLNTYCEDY